MTLDHFGTNVNAAQFVEVGDAHTVTAIDGTVLRVVSRPAAGLVLKFRNASTLEALSDVTVDGSGYWEVSWEDAPLVQVSVDGGMTWLPGELVSREAQNAAVTASLDVQTALDTASYAASGVAALDSRVAAIEVGGGSGGPVSAASITDATSVGRALIKATDAPAARAAIGAGTSTLSIGSTSGTAKDGAWKPTAADVSDAGVAGRAVMKAADTDAAKTAIGLDQVSNTSDANKPVSNAQATVLAGKQGKIRQYVSEAAALADAANIADNEPILVVPS